MGSLRLSARSRGPFAWVRSDHDVRLPGLGDTDHLAALEGQDLPRSTILACDRPSESIVYRWIIPPYLAKPTHRFHHTRRRAAPPLPDRCIEESCRYSVGTCHYCTKRK